MTAAVPPLVSSLSANSMTNTLLVRSCCRLKDREAFGRGWIIRRELKKIGEPRVIKARKFKKLENFTRRHTQGSRCMKERRSIQRLGTDTAETLSKGTGETAHSKGATLDRRFSRHEVSTLSHWAIVINLEGDLWERERGCITNDT